MADFAFVMTAVAFFALCAAYVRGCERIIAGSEEVSEPVGDDQTAAQP